MDFLLWGVEAGESSPKPGPKPDGARPLRPTTTGASVTNRGNREAIRSGSLRFPRSLLTSGSLREFLAVNVVILAAGQGKRMHSDRPKVLHPLAGRPLLAHVIDTARVARAVARVRRVRARRRAGARSDRRRLDRLGAAGAAARHRARAPAGVAAARRGRADARPLRRRAADARRHAARDGRGRRRRRRAPYRDARRPDGLRPHRPRGRRGEAHRRGEGRHCSPTRPARGEHRDHGPADAASRALAREPPRRQRATRVLPDRRRRGRRGRRRPGARGAARRPPGRRSASTARRSSPSSSACTARTSPGGCSPRASRSPIRRASTSAASSSAGATSRSTSTACSRATSSSATACRSARTACSATSASTPTPGSSRSATCEEADIGRNCRIGPYARLRPGAQLAEDVHIGNFVEVKASTIGAGSKANHLAYIGDTEVGRNVNVGAGTITCNYDGANKHRTVIEDDVFIGSDTQLVAPVRVGRGATLGAGTTLTEDAPPGELTISRARQMTIPGWKRPVRKGRGKGEARRAEPRSCAGRDRSSPSPCVPALTMCGIVGAIADRDVVPILAEGLKRLEYRGYDSAGHRGAGRRDPARAARRPRGGDGSRRAEPKGLPGTARHRPHALGHPRRRHRAQRAPARLAAARSRSSTTASSRTTRSSAQRLKALGYAFESQTDTEVVAHLDPPLLPRDARPVRRHAARGRRPRGAYAIAVVSARGARGAGRRAHGLPAGGRAWATARTSSPPTCPRCSVARRAA